MYVLVVLTARAYDHYHEDDVDEDCDKVDYDWRYLRFCRFVSSLSIRVSIRERTAFKQICPIRTD